jgi:hypothetical protein
MVMKSFEPALISQRKLQNSKNKLQEIQDLTFMSSFIENKKNPRKKPQQVCTIMVIICRYFVFHLWETESNNMWHIYGSWCLVGKVSNKNLPFLFVGTAPVFAGNLWGKPVTLHSRQMYTRTKMTHFNYLWIYRLIELGKMLKIWIRRHDLLPYFLGTAW